MYLLDSHCDTPSQILRGLDMSLDNPGSHIDFPKLRRGGVDAAFFALYIPAELDEKAALDHALKLYEGIRKTVESNPDKAAFATTQLQGYENKAKGLFSVFLGLENGSPIGGSLERIEQFYEMGIRYITLCHSKDNEICDSCASAVKKWNGLSPFGREVVSEMNRLGMLIDVSHISDKSFYDVLECSSRPVVATHSCCRALADHPRNMSDDMIKALAEQGGVIQINFYPVFLDNSIVEKDGRFIGTRPSLERIADHIDHAVSIAGIDHVGIGSDFDGIDIAPIGLEDISLMPRLFDELRSRGYRESDLEKIASGNFFNVI